MKLQATIIHSYDRIKDDLNKIWHEETILKTDIDPNDNLDENFDYDRFIDEKIKFKTDHKRFEIDFPFKDYHVLLVDNYTNCEKRMKNLRKKLRILMTFLRNNELTTLLKKLLQDYNDIFKEQQLEQHY